FARYTTHSLPKTRVIRTKETIPESTRCSRQRIQLLPAQLDPDRPPAPQLLDPMCPPSIGRLRPTTVFSNKSAKLKITFRIGGTEPIIIPTRRLCEIEASAVQTDTSKIDHILDVHGMRMPFNTNTINCVRDRFEVLFGNQF